jgi:hypothetical protein
MKRPGARNADCRNAELARNARQRVAHRGRWSVAEPWVWSIIYSPRSFRAVRFYGFYPGLTLPYEKLKTRLGAP